MATPPRRPFDSPTTQLLHMVFHPTKNPLLSSERSPCTQSQPESCRDDLESCVYVGLGQGRGGLATAWCKEVVGSWQKVVFLKKAKPNSRDEEGGSDLLLQKNTTLKQLWLVFRGENGGIHKPAITPSPGLLRGEG